MREDEENEFFPLSQVVREFKLQLSLNGRSKIDFYDMASHRGLSTRAAVFVVQCFSNRSFTFGRDCEKELVLIKNNVPTDSFVSRSNQGINCYSFSCFDELVEDETVNAVLEALGFAAQNGLTHNELSKLGKFNYNLIDKLVQAGVLTKGWVMSSSNATPTKRTTGSCVIAHLTCYSDEARSKPDGLIFHCSERSRMLILQMLKMLLMKNNLPYMCCENVSGYLLVGKKQMQYLRNLVINLERQNVILPVNFRRKQSSAITRHGNIGKVRCMWSVCKDGERKSQIKVTRDRTLPFYEQIDLQIRNFGGINTTEIRNFAAITRKRAFKTAQELINLCGFPTVKLLEGKTFQYKILPASLDSGRCSALIGTNANKVNVTTTIGLLEANLNDSICIKKNSCSYFMEGDQYSLNYNESLLLSTLNSSVFGVKALSEITQIMRQFYRDSTGVVLNKRAIERAQDQLLELNYIESFTMNLPENQAGHFSKIGLVQFLALRHSDICVDERVRKYVSLVCERNLTSIEDARAVERECVESELIRSAVTGSSKRTGRQIKDQSPKMNETTDEVIISSNTLKFDTCIINDPVSENFKHAVKFDKGFEKRDGLKKFWNTDEERVLVITFLNNLLVRKPRNGLPHYLKSEPPSQKVSKEISFIYPEDSFFDFPLKRVDLRLVHTFYILNAAVKTSSHGWSSCRRRSFHVLRNISTIGHFVAHVVQRSVLMADFPRLNELLLYNKVLISKIRIKELVNEVRNCVLKHLTCSYSSFRFKDLVNQSHFEFDSQSVKSVLKELNFYGLLQINNSYDLKPFSGDELENLQATFRFTQSYQKSIIDRPFGLVFYTVLFNRPIDVYPYFNRYRYEDARAAEFLIFTFEVIEKLQILKCLFCGNASPRTVRIAELLCSTITIQESGYNKSQSEFYLTDFSGETSFPGILRVDDGVMLKRSDLLEMSWVKLAFDNTSQFCSRLSKISLNAIDEGYPFGNSSCVLDSFAIYAGHVLAFLAEYPGSSIHQIHTVLLILPFAIVKTLMVIMERLALVRILRSGVRCRISNSFDSSFIWESEFTNVQIDEVPVDCFELCLINNN